MSNELDGVPAEIDCAEALVQLQDYLKRELTADTAERIRLHVQRCGHCFGQLRFEEQFLRFLQTRRTDVRCPDALRLRITDALRTEAADN